MLNIIYLFYCITLFSFFRKIIALKRTCNFFKIIKPQIEGRNAVSTTTGKSHRQVKKQMQQVCFIFITKKNIKI